MVNPFPIEQKICLFLTFLKKKKSQNAMSCADPESFARGGPTLMGFFLGRGGGYEGKEDPNRTYSGPLSAC